MSQCAIYIKVIMVLNTLLQITVAIFGSNQDIYGKNQDWKSWKKLFARKLKLLWLCYGTITVTAWIKLYSKNPDWKTGSNKELAC